MKTKVFLMEYERGWGSRLDETKEFDTRGEALKFDEEFNSHNTSKTVPDWYMTATVDEL